jgi:hypothetical protein
MSSCQDSALCRGCCHAIGRRDFLRHCGAAAVAAVGSVAPAARAADELAGRKVRVAAVFLSNIYVREIWPYPGFDTQGRQRELLAALQGGCPEITFVPVTVQTPADLQNAVALKDDVDGYLIYTMTLDWRHRRELIDLARLGKPTLVANEFLGGCGVFLTGFSQLAAEKLPAAPVSATRVEDLVAVARQFALLGKPGATPASFVQACQRASRETFPAGAPAVCSDDPLKLTEIGECVKRFRDARFLIVGRGQPGQEQDFLGAKSLSMDFEELLSCYQQVDRDEAAQWSRRWLDRGATLPAGEYVEPSRPLPEAVEKAGAMYLAMLQLLKKHGTDTVTMDCLGGFGSGKLPAYPCLGFMQILDDGGQGVCEAMPDDTVSMLMARILTGRPGFVSDPALDTSKNQVVYAHCVGTTKVFGPEGASNGYRIRTLHNRDPHGACAESLMPEGYMTTTFRTNVAHKQLVIHQARSLGALDDEKGCRTKLIGEVCGDIGKLFQHWHRFSWHRVTVFGDVKEPLAEFGKALGLEVIEEA